MAYSVPGYSKSVGTKYGFTYDPAKVAQYMTAAGYTKVGGAWSKDGQPLVVTLKTWNATQISRAAQIIQSELGTVGIDVKIQQTDAGTFLSQLAQGNFQFDLDRYTFNADAVGLTDLFKSPGKWKNHSDPVLDQMLSKADATLNWTQRKAILDQIQARLLQRADVVPLFSDTFLIAARKVVHGFHFDGMGVPDYHGVWLSQ